MTDPAPFRPSRRHLLKVVASGSALMAAPALANAPLTSARPLPRPSGRSLVPTARALMEREGLRESAGFVALDAETGQFLEGWRGAIAAPPASALKAITAGYALDRLGEGHSFATRLIATGPVEGGVIQGDLVLAGGGDPVLSTPQLAVMARRLARGGVTGITGRFVVWEGALPYVAELEPAQPDHLGYNPSLSGLNLNFNRVHFSWSRSNGRYSTQLDARGGDWVPEVASSRMRVIDRSLPVYTLDHSGAVDEWTVARRQLGGSGSRWLPVRNSGAYAGDVFRTIAALRGVILPPAASVQDLPEGTVLVAHDSPPLTDIVRGMLRFSTNVTAAAIGVAASTSVGVPATLPASGRAMQAWARARLGMRSARIVDHSGLGDGTRITPAAMAQAMVGLKDGAVPGLMRPFVMTDRNGNADPNHPVSVRAKTGTLNFVSALSGYATVPGGRRIAFAILVGDLDRRARGLASGAEIPDGARPWNRRAKRLQRALLTRWGRVYGGGA